MLKLNSSGDTIVEVMLALAFLSFAFVISYATANAALISSQNSQEHSLALEYIDAQIEALRYQATQNLIPAAEFAKPTNPKAAFCLNASGTGIVTSTFFVYGSNKPSLYPPSCQIPGPGFNYYIAIRPSNTINDDFQITIWWPGLGNLGVQTETLAYKVYDD